MTGLQTRVAEAKAFGKVAVLYGGWSAEREVSLMSGNAVLAALRGRGVDAHGIDAGRDLLAVLAGGGFDRAFIALHGPFGEDGTLQGALEVLGLPYTGSGVLASALCMDKWRTKLLWRAAGLPVPEFELLTAASDFDAVAGRLGLPLFVKPSTQGSSVGVSKVRHVSELRDAWALAARYDHVVLAERAIGGGEYTAAIVDGEALPVVKIEPATEFYDYEAKYFRDDTQYRCPCGLPPAREAELRALARSAFELVGGRSWGRVDFLLDEAGAAYLLEVNTAPGMTGHSLVPMAARAAGADFPALCWRILETTLTEGGA